MRNQYLGLALGVSLSVICVTIGQSQERTPPPLEKSKAVPWSKLGKKGEGVLTLSYFHEGNGCTQDYWGVTNGRDDGSVSPNDEARSMDLRGPTGTTFRVYDSRNFARTDDFSQIQKKDGNAVCVSSFEHSSPGEWVSFRGYWLWYSGGNGLDGKVSSIQWD
jgi:hypothetical protein